VRVRIRRFGKLWSERSKAGQAHLFEAFAGHGGLERTVLVHHSDPGVQYASGDYRDHLARQGTVVSMRRTGRCWDNAVAESFFATLEWELVERSDWRTRDEARSAIFKDLALWYNPRRRHSSLSYLSPVDYEQQLVCRAKAA
jgi:putative transposase